MEKKLTNEIFCTLSSDDIEVDKITNKIHIKYINTGIIVFFNQNDESEILLEMIKKHAKHSIGCSVMLYDASEDNRFENIPFILEYISETSSTGVKIETQKINYHISDYHICNILNKI